MVTGVAIKGLLGYGIAGYVGVERSGLSVGEGIASWSYSVWLERIVVGFYYWIIGLVAILSIHVFMPDITLSILPFMLSWWLFCG